MKTPTPPTVEELNEAQAAWNAGTGQWERFEDWKPREFEPRRTVTTD
jgi:hypothetical protein